MELSWKTKSVFVVTGVFIGLLVTTQFKSSVPTSSFLSDELEVQNEIIKSFLDDQALLKSKLVALRQKIEENQAKLATSKNSGNLQILETLKSELGLQQAKGPGVEILMADGVAASSIKDPEVSQFLINAADLRDVVNLLRTTGASAIAINEQRIIASTPISSLGSTIMVNNFHMLPPFRITVTGDPEVILQRLADKTSLTDIYKRLEEKRIGFSYKAMENLILPVYNGNLTTDHLGSPSIEIASP